MRIARQIAIRAEPELVWDVITDLRHAKEWAQGFDDYPFISEQWPAEGAEATWRYHFAFLSADIQLKLASSSRGRHLQIDNIGVFGRGSECYRFSFSGGKTMVYYETFSELTLFGKIMLPLTIRTLLWQIETTMGNLKHYCEQRSPET